MKMQCPISPPPFSNTNNLTSFMSDLTLIPLTKPPSQISIKHLPNPNLNQVSDPPLFPFSTQIPRPVSWLTIHQAKPSSFDTPGAAPRGSASPPAPQPKPRTPQPPPLLPTTSGVNPLSLKCSYRPALRKVFNCLSCFKESCESVI